MLLLTGVSALAFFGTGCTSSSRPLPSAAHSNPLADCPDSPNCERISESYSVAPDRLFAATQTALDTLGPAHLQTAPDSMRASAVYRVAWIFKDDVDVAVESRSDGSMLHLRSASRVGHSDLGVNRRRAHRILSAVKEQLSAQQPARE